MGTNSNQKKAAKEFVARWKDKGYEKGETQRFWLDLLQNVFGILTSLVHNARMWTVGGRLKSDYRYSKNIVYNNFPWSTVTQKKVEKIEQTAQAILDAREKYPDATLADMYGNMVLFPELLKAHRANDAAVMEAYGFDKNLDENQIITLLLQQYKKLTE